MRPKHLKPCKINSNVDNNNQPPKELNAPMWDQEARGPIMEGIGTCVNSSLRIELHVGHNGHTERGGESMCEKFKFFTFF